MASALEIGDTATVYKTWSLIKNEDVKVLQKWCEMQKCLPRLTEMQIINFLHSTQGSGEAAKRKIDGFYSVRTHSPEFFAKRNPRDVNLSLIMFFAWPKPTNDGARVVMSRLIDHNPDKYTFAEHIKIFDMSTMFTLNRDGPADGYIFIVDLAGVTFSHLAKLHVLQLKKFFLYLQECMPLKIKGWHFINIGNVMEKILLLIRPFLKKEILQVLHTHTDMETIYEMIPRESFPNDYPGGKAPSCEHQINDITECILQNEAYFIEEELQVIDESLRTGKPKNSSDIFDVEGTFKKLDID